MTGAAGGRFRWPAGWRDRCRRVGVGLVVIVGYLFWPPLILWLILSRGRRIAQGRSPGRSGAVGGAAPASHIAPGPTEERPVWTLHDPPETVREALGWAGQGMRIYYLNRPPLVWAVVFYLAIQFPFWLLSQSDRPDLGPLPVPGLTVDVWDER
ncbi:MAG: hypothetical protein ACTS3R_16185 [Inquilinaceae bacterium]